MTKLTADEVFQILGIDPEGDQERLAYLGWIRQALADGWEFCPGPKNGPSCCELHSMTGHFASVKLGSKNYIEAWDLVSGGYAVIEPPYSRRDMQRALHRSLKDESA